MSHTLPPRIGELTKEGRQTLQKIHESFGCGRGSFVKPLGLEFVLDLTLDNEGERFWMVSATSRLSFYPKSQMMQIWLGEGAHTKTVFILGDGTILARSVEYLELSVVEPKSKTSAVK